MSHSEPFYCKASYRLLTLTASVLLSLLASILWAPYTHATSQSSPSEGPEANSPKNEQILDQIVTTINRSIILESDIKERIQQVIRAFPADRPLPPPQVLVKQLLDRMILETIQFEMANQIGIRINDNELNDAILDIARQNKLSFSAFQNKLSQQGIPYVDFREQIKRDMILNQVQQRSIGRRIQVTDQDANTFLTSPIGKEQLAADYRLQHILIAIEDEEDTTQIQQAQAKADDIFSQLIQDSSRFDALAIEHSNSSTALEGGDLGWRPVKALPTLFADQAIAMKVGEVSKPIKSPSGFHIIRLAERRGKQQQMVQQYKVRHILIKPNEIRSNTASKRLIDTIYNKLLINQHDFGQLAQTYSDDTGSARKGGDLGWVSPGQMVPQFEKMMQQTPLNTFSQPFESAFGWHVLEVSHTRTEDFSDEFRIAQAKNFVFKRKFEEELPLWLREIRQDAFVEQKVSIEVLTQRISDDTFRSSAIQ